MPSISAQRKSITARLRNRSLNGQNKSAMAASSAASALSSSTTPAFVRQSRSEISNKFGELEWAQRHRLMQGTQSPNSPTNAATTGGASPFSRLPSDLVTSRNRYRDIEPFAQNRVKLKVPAGVNDYINASPIRLGNRRYIATQGPKETSVNHFYRMLAAEVQSPAVVVMLTQTHELGREKCFQYYPLSAEESPLVVPADEEIADGFKGEVHLEGVEYDAKSRSQVRRLRFRTTPTDSDSGSSREIEIQHLLFSGWPDFLVPEGEDRTALVELIRLSAWLNREQDPLQSSQPSTTQPNGEPPPPTDTSNTSPRIIHCSAGVGRSGTFIALDYLLFLLSSGQLDDIAPDRDPVVETVDALRQQRMYMVQGAEQFQLLYEVLREQMAVRQQTQAAVGANAAVDKAGVK